MTSGRAGWAAAAAAHATVIAGSHRKYHRLFIRVPPSPDRQQPLGKLLSPPHRDLEVRLADLPGPIPDIARADRAAIDRRDRRHLLAAAAEERLAREVELGAV